MRAYPARVASLAFITALTATWIVRGQTAANQSLVVIENLGLPAIDEGVVQDDSHTPNTDEAIRRRALGAASPPGGRARDRPLRSGARHREVP